MKAGKASLLVGYLCTLFYAVVLSSSGLAEQRLLAKEHQKISEEVERLAIENQVLEEREKRLQNDSYALEKEARKYYLLSESSRVIKFVEAMSAKELSPSGPKAAQVSLQMKMTEPPLFVLRFFYISFSVFLCLGVYFKLKSLPPQSKL
ncbi:septum formation initiator [Leptospira ryugenii]|uniref:Septum formation initiator n=1 Tax=Leptospira ryugenii TaxID=1917863 RepID=A0A2P2DWT5_9LEPT|nr:septum formation initiator family protein [Leptospira ryugenii]GBF49094.1 septum formation initiator [Leptospira ryugenii]